MRKVGCDDYRRTFRRETDKARHKCLAEWQKSVQDQQGAVQCDVHVRRIRSRSVHRCIGPMRLRHALRAMF